VYIIEMLRLIIFKKIVEVAFKEISGE